SKVENAPEEVREVHKLLVENAIERFGDKEFGEDAVYVERPEQAPAPLVDGLHESLRYGDPFRHPAFPRLRPTPGGFDDVPQSYGGHAISLQTQMQGE
ncbi:MAG: hypothetical protein ACPHUF_02750, partial [Gammaproteobacteria bacterium]